jgi:acetolactate synthase-1/2/3 large subunit
MSQMRGAQTLVKALEQEGVEYVFGGAGHGDTNILDALYDSPIEFKLVRHEQAAAHIADGYARVAGKPGVCCASVGPGAANMLMGVAAAAHASSPVVAISGGVLASMAGKGQLQETTRPETPTDDCYLQAVQPFVKRAWRVQDPHLIPDVVRRAFAVAQMGRPGPVWIEIPWDLQAGKCEVNLREMPSLRFPVRVRADAEATRAAAEKLANAQCPVIVAGYGAVLSGASSQLLELAALLGAPIATTYPAKGIIPEDHPLSVGMIGWLGHPVAHDLIRDHADCILAVGIRFSDLSTCWWTEGMPFVKENRFIQLDIEPSEIGKNYPAEVGLVGDAAATLQEMIAITKGLQTREKKAETIALVNQLKASFKLEIPESGGSGMEPLKVAADLREILPRQSIMVLDTGNHAHYFSAFYPIYAGGKLLNPGGWTPMGFAPAAAIGAKLAAPDLPCISITGDGGFFMMCQEVITAVEWDLPVVWIVFNNQALGAIRDGQVYDFGERIIGTEFRERADFAQLARAFKAEGISVNEYSELTPAVEHALNCGKPCVIDLILERDAIPPPVAGSWYEPERGVLRPKPRAV